MNKRQIIDGLVRQIEAEVESLRRCVAHTRAEVRDAPGRMTSRYDSSRTELGWLADGQARLLEEREQALALVQSTDRVPESPGVRTVAV